jgi:surfactin synthase thioesterase subunit
MTDLDEAIKAAKAEVLPYESWERLVGETAHAFAAFCIFRDLGAERNIRKAVSISLTSGEKDEAACAKSYSGWRNWSFKYRWRERAADYDRYIEKLKQSELRKTIEAQGEQHRAVTGKMLEVVKKKLDTMNPDDLTHNNVTEWVQTAIRADREAAGLVTGNGKPEVKQGELNFTPDFQGL